MSRLTSIVAGASVLASFVLLSGCGGAVTPSSMQSASAIRAANHRSWMMRGATTEALLYVSNVGTSTVTAYSWPHGTLVGTLFGFSSPQGLCLDEKGDVYVTDLGSFRIYEYQHGGFTVIKGLVDPYYYPHACSIDPTTGNLAVADTYSGVLIYANASGNPTLYSDSSFTSYSFLDYDNQGNLFVDGASASGQLLAQLPKGAGSLGPLYLNKFPVLATGLHWDGKYLAVGDAGVVPNVVYQFSISGRLGTLEGTTTLSGSKAVQQLWIPHSAAGQGVTIVGADSGNDDVKHWEYPSGNPAGAIKRAVSNPLGVAISR